MSATALNEVCKVSNEARPRSDVSLPLNEVCKVSGKPTSALNKLPEVPATMQLGEVASSLGLSEAQLKRRHLRMTRGDGFPPPLPGGGWAWSRRAFEIWVAANGTRSATGAAEHGNDNDGLDALVHEQNAALRHRYGARS